MNLFDPDTFAVAPAVSSGAELECGMTVAAASELGVQRLNGRCRECKARMSILTGNVRGYYGAAPGFVKPDGDVIAASDVRARCSCGGWALLKRVQGKVDTSVRCDARCEYAIGPKCDCQCGGANHGAGHHHG